MNDLLAYLFTVFALAVITLSVIAKPDIAETAIKAITRVLTTIFELLLSLFGVTRAFNQSTEQSKEERRKEADCSDSPVTYSQE